MCKKVTLIWALICMFVMTSLAANKRFTLVIDPGHGGHDAGALGAISKEKNINLAVALRFGKDVEQNLPGGKSHLYPQDGCLHPVAMKRANIANGANADSLHLRAYQCLACR